MNTLRQGSSLGTRDPCKSPEGSTSLCSPNSFLAVKMFIQVTISSPANKSLGSESGSSWEQQLGEQAARPGLGVDSWEPSQSPGDHFMLRDRFLPPPLRGTTGQRPPATQKEAPGLRAQEAAFRSFSAPSAGPARAALHLTPSRELQRLSPLISKTAISLHSAPL